MPTGKQKSVKLGGEPAFPWTVPRAPDERSGMTLRDWFAGQALSAAAEAWAGNHPESGKTFTTQWPARALASRAYELADAMLRERKKP